MFLRRATLLFLMLSVPSPAEEPRHAHAVAAQALGQLLRDNQRFVDGHDSAYFRRFRDGQHPRITLLACADSRFHASDIDADADGDVFEVRNIGNQMSTSAGSIDYAVHHLHTPLLMVVGHVGCGAVQAALGDYSEEPQSIRHELDGLHLSIWKTHATGSPSERWLRSVVGNVHEQAAAARREFAAEVKSGQLTVVGAVYDFRNDLAQGTGRLVVVDVDGETDPARIAQTPLMREATHRH